jgi:single-strand DNA-binding protein
MPFSLNRVTLIGRVGQDPELRTIPSGAQTCTFSLATSESFKDRNGEWKEETEWHRIVCWEKTAEQANKYLKKGSRVAVEGKIKRREYDKDGAKQNITEIRAASLIFLESRDKNDSSDDSSYSSNYSDKGPASHVAENNDDDDIPF